MVKTDRRNFIKGALAGAFGAALTWAGMVKAKVEQVTQANTKRLHRITVCDLPAISFAPNLQLTGDGYGVIATDTGIMFITYDGEIWYSLTEEAATHGNATPYVSRIASADRGAGIVTFELVEDRAPPSDLPDDLVVKAEEAEPVIVDMSKEEIQAFYYDGDQVWAVSNKGSEFHSCDKGATWHEESIQWPIVIRNPPTYADTGELTVPLGTTWFVDETNGDDSNDGLSPETALLTWAEMEARCAAPSSVRVFPLGGDTPDCIAVLSDDLSDVTAHWDIHRDWRDRGFVWSDAGSGFGTYVHWSNDGSDENGTGTYEDPVATEACAMAIADNPPFRV